MAEQTTQDAMREMGELIDPVQEALRKMLHEFGDEHYHTCPVDNDSGPCDCFAGHLIVKARATLEVAVNQQSGDKDMTHSGGKPHNVGDKGQRYEVLAHGYPKEELDNVIGWSDTLEGAEWMMRAILVSPGCTSAKIFDRQENRGVIKRYAGILR